MRQFYNNPAIERIGAGEEDPTQSVLLDGPTGLKQMSTAELVSGPRTYTSTQKASVVGALGIPSSNVPPGGCALVFTGTGNIDLNVQLTGGSYNVQWWDGTVTTHATFASSKAVPGSGAWAGLANKPVYVWPATATESITSLYSFATVVSANVTGMTQLQNLHFNNFNAPQLDGLATLSSLNNLQLAMAGRLQSLDVSPLKDTLTQLQLRFAPVLTELRAKDCALSYYTTTSSYYYGNSFAGLDAISAGALTTFFEDLAPALGSLNFVGTSTAGVDLTIATNKGYTLLGV